LLDSIIDPRVAFAFGAGMVAAFNPCGAAMLPAYIGYQLGDVGDASDPLKKVLRGLYLGAVATVGFLVFSLAVGLIIITGGEAVTTFFPLAGLGVGVAILLMGLWFIISGKHLGIWAATRVRAGSQRSAKGVFLFGMAYAISSLGCALPVFLAAVGVLAGQNLGNLDLLPSLLRFGSYGLGMGMVIMVITIGVVFLRESVSMLLRAIFPFVSIAGNLALVGAGAYLIWYWVLGDGGEFLSIRLEELL
jgi:cytochrome c-type biogenesis protein